MAIQFYRDEGVRDIAESANTKAARRTLLYSCSVETWGFEATRHSNNSWFLQNMSLVQLHQQARRRLAALDAMTALADLALFPGWRLEQLKGDRTGQYSIRINDQYRICFQWNGIDVLNVEITDYH